jgi:hypothetical protein
MSLSSESAAHRLCLQEARYHVLHGLWPVGEGGGVALGGLLLTSEHGPHDPNFHTPGELELELEIDLHGNYSLVQSGWRRRGTHPAWPPPYDVTCRYPRCPWPPLVLRALSPKPACSFMRTPASLQAALSFR